MAEAARLALWHVHVTRPSWPLRMHGRLGWAVFKCFALRFLQSKLRDPKADALILDSSFIAG